MTTITKEDVKNEFLNKKRKRYILLYEYYKEAYFSNGYPAWYISDKISKDLNIPITEAMIYYINKHIINKGKKISVSSSPTLPLENSEIDSWEDVFKQKPKSRNHLVAIFTYDGYYSWTLT